MKVIPFPLIDGKLPPTPLPVTARGLLGSSALGGNQGRCRLPTGALLLRCIPRAQGLAWPRRGENLQLLILRPTCTTPEFNPHGLPSRQQPRRNKQNRIEMVRGSSVGGEGKPSSSHPYIQDHLGCPISPEPPNLAQPPYSSLPRSTPAWSSSTLCPTPEQPATGKAGPLSLYLEAQSVLESSSHSIIGLILIMH